MADFINGFLIALGLIVAIGAQNAWVLGMSIRGIHPWPIAAVCFSLDAALMAIGIAGFQAIQSKLPYFIPWMTWFGILMLTYLALQAGYRVIRGTNGLKQKSGQETLSMRSAVLLAMTISLLNPHVYLDTVLLVGSIAAALPEPWVFWLGSASASVVWFSALAAIGKPLGVWLSSPTRWRLFDGSITLIMAYVAWSLFQTLA